MEGVGEGHEMQVASARSVDHFEKLEQIGEGTYGQVRYNRTVFFRLEP